MSGATAVERAFLAVSWGLRRPPGLPAQGGPHGQYTGLRPAPVVGDDTLTEHRGKKVYGKARHRDAVRSSHSYTAWRYGHKWVVLAVLVKFPFAARRWALPVLVDLYRTPEVDRVEKRTHKTPAQLMCRLLRL